MLDLGYHFVLNLVFGLLASFSPCLFPLLPSYVALTVKTKQSKSKLMLSSLALIAGVMIVFLTLGMISNLIGSFLISNYSTFAKIQGIILILAGMLLIKTPGFLAEFSAPDFIQNWLYSDERGGRPILFSFILGLIFTVIAAPCASGFFLAVWVTSIGENFIIQLILVFAFSLGVGIPFIMMSVFLPQFEGDTISKIRSTTSKVTLILGFILILVGLYLIAKVSPYQLPVIN